MEVQLGQHRYDEYAKKCMLKAVAAHIKAGCYNVVPYTDSEGSTCVRFSVPSQRRLSYLGSYLRPALVYDEDVIGSAVCSVKLKDVIAGTKVEY